MGFLGFFGRAEGAERRGGLDWGFLLHVVIWAVVGSGDLGRFVLFCNLGYGRG